MSAPPVPGLPVEGDVPVFAAPWEAQAFAMAMLLRDRGVFTWAEWADRLGAVIRAAGEADTGERYYEHWLTALEQLAVEKGAASLGELLDLQDAWDRAAKATPHGEPITLDRSASPHA